MVCHEALHRVMVKDVGPVWAVRLPLKLDVGIVNTFGNIFGDSVGLLLCLHRWFTSPLYNTTNIGLQHITGFRAWARPYKGPYSED